MWCGDGVSGILGPVIMPFPAPSDPIDTRAEVFLRYLDFFRSRLVDKVSALSEDEARSSRLPSGWTPIALAKHLTYVEMRWLELGFLGAEVADPWGDQREDRWYVTPDEPIAEVIAALQERGRRSREIATHTTVSRHTVAMVNGDAARRYHRLSSYEPDREWTTPVTDPLVLQDFQPNDLDRLPPPVKRYPADLPVVALPRDLPTNPRSATEVLAAAPVTPMAELDLGNLARLLYLSAGVVRTATRRGRHILYRAAGSAGARFPLEVYVAARGVSDLPDAVYWYDPVNHALVRLADAPAGEATTVVVTGVPWRTGWRYSERGYRHLYWDGGTMLAQMLALADSAGIPTQLRTTFPDVALTELVGADGRHEFPLFLVSLGSGAPAIGASGPAAAGTIDDEPLEFPLVTLTQRAGDGDRLGDPWPRGNPLPGPIPDSAALDEVILQRGSTRRMVYGAQIGRPILDWSLAAALRGLADYPQFVAVHAVAGTEPGLYRWPDLDHPIHPGDLREEVLRICLDQMLGAEASYVLMTAADLDSLDDRSYRDAQLAAGIVEGRLHLAAYALGIGASGMTFLDSELPALFGEPLAGLLFTCVGVPEYPNRAGGRPGAAARVTPVMPRLREGA